MDFKKRYENLIRRIEKCERKFQTQKEENTLEIWNMEKNSRTTTKTVRGNKKQ